MTESHTNHVYFDWDKTWSLLISEIASPCESVQVDTPAILVVFQSDHKINQRPFALLDLL